jgi:hypothetical protein
VRNQLSNRIDKLFFLCQLFHCNALSSLVCICCWSSHTNLHHSFGRNCPANWTRGEKFSLALFYLFWAGCIITVYCYWCGFPLWSQASSHDPCIHTTRLGQGVTWTLLYHTHFSFHGTVSETCRHKKKKTYSICLQEGQYTFLIHSTPQMMNG